MAEKYSSKPHEARSTWHCQTHHTWLFPSGTRNKQEDKGVVAEAEDIYTQVEDMNWQQQQKQSNISIWPSWLCIKFL